MRALLLDAPGPTASLRVGEVLAPHPEVGQVRVRVEACGLNPVDGQVAASGHPAWAWPHVLGLDVAGVVDELGEGVTQWALGDRVAFHGDLRQRGGLAEHAVADVDVLARVPRGLDAVAAAALPCAGITAFQAVHRRLHVRAGDLVLVTGGAGGVGGVAVQLAAQAGARVVATASGYNVDHVQGLGAVAVIDHRTEDVAARVRAITGGRGVDAVVDTVGPASATAALGLLRYAGGLAAVAGRPDLDAVPSFTLAPSVHEIAVGAAYSHGGSRARRDLGVVLDELLVRAADHRLDPRVTAVVPLEGVAGALAELAGRHVRGKIVATL